MVSERRNLIVGTNVEDFFRGMVTTAVANQHVEATEHTLHYVVNLLTTFTHAERFYDRTPEGMMIRPLALLYADAIEAASAEERNQALRRLGDVALFVCGVFPDSLNRKPVDVDYYAAMGGNAYGYLSVTVRDTARWRTMGEVFDELSGKFSEFVDVLGEVSEQAHFSKDSDLMRLYERWVRTGSKRLARRLRALGIHPATGSVSRRHH